MKKTQWIFSTPFLVIFGLVMMMFFVPAPSAYASSSAQNGQSITLEAAPDSIYYETTTIQSTPGPHTIQAETYRHGRWYSGTLTKISEQVDPTGPFYLTRYGGTLY